MSQTQVATLDENRATVRSMLEKSSGEIEKALAGLIDPAKFSRICLTTYQRGGEKMAKADPRSFIAAVIEAAQLGLSPDGVLGECYLIPRWDWRLGCQAVNFQLGYPGMMKLIRRGGDVLEVVPEVVHENDEFEVTLGTSRGITHRPWFSLGKSEPGNVVAAYATARMRDGTMSFKTVTLPELHAAAEASGNPKDKEWSDVWRDHFAAMAMKTAVLRLCKWLPLPDTIARAFKRDEYREAGVADADLHAMIRQLGGTQQREEIVIHQDEERANSPEALDEAKTKKKREQLYGAVWTAAGRFFHASQVELDRYNGGKAKFEKFVAWSADTGTPDCEQVYSDDELRRIWQLTRAKAMLIEWNDSHEEDARATCEAFAGFMQRLDDDVTKQSDDEKFEAKR